MVYGVTQMGGNISVEYRILRSNDRNRRMLQLQKLTGRMGYISKESYIEIKNQLKIGFKIKTVIQSL
jgi:hypothetical protein